MPFVLSTARTALHSTRYILLQSVALEYWLGARSPLEGLHSLGCVLNARPADDGRRTCTTVVGSRALFNINSVLLTAVIGACIPLEALRAVLLVRSC